MAFSQNKISFSGKIHNQKNEALPFAIIYIEELQKSIISNEDGTFNVKVVPGRYRIKARFIGMEDLVKQVEINPADTCMMLYLKPNIQQLQTIQINGNRESDNVKENSLSSVFIKSEALQSSGAGSLAKAIEQLPGVASISTGNAISKPVLRGMSFNRVIVVENGVKQEGQQWGQDHGLEIDIFNVADVEIIKGPNSLMYGSDAIGGAIVIKPFSVSQDSGFKHGIMASYKSVNQAKSVHAFTSAKLKNWYYRLNITAQQYNDLRVPADSFVYNGFKLPIVNERLKNTAGNEISGAGLIGYQSKKLKSEIYVSNVRQTPGFFSGAHGIPQSYQLQPDGNTSNIDLPRQVINHFKLIQQNNIFFAKSHLETTIGIQRNNRSEYSFPHFHGYGNIPNNNLEFNFILDTRNIGFKYHFPSILNTQNVLGISFQNQKNRIAGFNYFLPAYTSNNANLYWTTKKSIGKFWFNTGIRADFTQMKIIGYNEAVYNSDFSSINFYRTRNNSIQRNYQNIIGNIGINYIVNQYITIKSNFGNGLHVPTPVELAANGIHHGTFRHEQGDSALKPETGNQIDVGLHLNYSRYSLQLNAFYYYFANHIYLSPSGRFSFLPEAGQIYRYRQDEAFMQGFELAQNIQLSEKFELKSGFDYVYAYNLSEQIPLPFITPTRLRNELIYSSSNGIQVFANWQYTTAQNQVAINEPATPAYSLFDCGLSGSVSFGKYQIKYFFTVNNIFDTRYLNHLSRFRILNIPEPGRNIAIQLQYLF
jgi:iron complex outermembrane receptor protein